MEELKKHFSSNPGALFIVAFQVLLVLAAAFLASGDSSIANEIGVCAFYALVIAVAVQIRVVLQEERRLTRADCGSTSRS